MSPAHIFRYFYRASPPLLGGRPLPKRAVTELHARAFAVPQARRCDEAWQPSSLSLVVALTDSPGHHAPWSERSPSDCLIPIHVVRPDPPPPPPPPPSALRIPAHDPTLLCPQTHLHPSCDDTGGPRLAAPDSALPSTEVFPGACQSSLVLVPSNVFAPSLSSCDTLRSWNTAIPSPPLPLLAPVQTTRPKAHAKQRGS
ncbi:hypothetical protein B0H14DRAFT_3425074 [Mycena olivaceomarginata]|nr:hypothetical protein B0H14DRAFT_3425074 [Mycena olivaceomarginata]